MKTINFILGFISGALSLVTMAIGFILGYDFHRKEDTDRRRARFASSFNNYKRDLDSYRSYYTDKEEDLNGDYND